MWARIYVKEKSFAIDDDDDDDNNNYVCEQKREVISCLVHVI